jgi:hypothetical protein
MTTNKRIKIIFFIIITVIRGTLHMVSEQRLQHLDLEQGHLIS